MANFQNLSFYSSSGVSQKAPFRIFPISFHFLFVFYPAPSLAYLSFLLFTHSFYLPSHIWPLNNTASSTFKTFSFVIKIITISLGLLFLSLLRMWKPNEDVYLFPFHLHGIFTNCHGQYKYCCPTYQTRWVF